MSTDYSALEADKAKHPDNYPARFPATQTIPRYWAFWTPERLSDWRAQRA